MKIDCISTNNSNYNKKTAFKQVLFRNQGTGYIFAPHCLKEGFITVDRLKKIVDELKPTRHFDLSLSPGIHHPDISLSPDSDGSRLCARSPIKRLFRFVIDDDYPYSPELLGEGPESVMTRISEPSESGSFFITHKSKEEQWNFFAEFNKLYKRKNDNGFLHTRNEVADLLFKTKLVQMLDSTKQKIISCGIINRHNIQCEKPLLDVMKKYLSQ